MNVQTSIIKTIKMKTNEWKTHNRSKKLESMRYGIKVRAYMNPWFSNLSPPTPSGPLIAHDAIENNYSRKNYITRDI